MGKQEGRTCGHLRRKQKPRKNIKQDSTADPTHKIQKVSATPLCVGARGRTHKPYGLDLCVELFWKSALCVSTLFLTHRSQP